MARLTELRGLVFLTRKLLASPVHTLSGSLSILGLLSVLLFWSLASIGPLAFSPLPHVGL